jgi:phosphate transport system protein
LPRIHFHQQLAELKERLMGMAALAQEAVETAVEAYLQQDKGLCRYVKQTEAAIDSAQRDVDEMAYKLLAKEQPMAVDLRFILAVIKINGDLERIGDQSTGITKRTKKTIKAGGAELPVDFTAMGEQVCLMIRLALRSLLEEDAKLADEVEKMDDEIDHMNHRAFDDLLKLIEDKPELTLQAMNGILVAKSLERIADHAANIATDVIFWIRGADVRHQLSMAVE